MKKVVLVLLLALGGNILSAQEDPLSVEELMQGAEQWAQENLDDDALAVLAQVDREKVEKILKGLQKDFQSQYVLDLGSMKEAARSVLPLLESYEETVPYAIWLKSRLDYLDVAEQLRRRTPIPKAEPGVPPKPLPNPEPQAERQAWTRKMEAAPWPPLAKPLVPDLKRIFAEQKVPPELVWIAEVESSFDPRACSPAGARGLFQLMPTTAKRYGLRTWPFDQRVKTEPSATAAAKYLRYLGGRFKDWRLALAAYNAGEGTVQNLLNKSRAKTFDAISTRLPAETQMYVPRVEATIWRREGVRITELAGVTAGT